MVVKFVLSRKECEKIRNIHFNQISFCEKNGIPMEHVGGFPLGNYAKFQHCDGSRLYQAQQFLCRT